MRPPAGWIPEYDSGLIEEAVAFAIRSNGETPYWRERSSVYRIQDEDRRTAEFLRLAMEEFQALGLGRPLEQALEERPIIGAAVMSCLVAPAVSARDEGAELFVEQRDGLSGSKRLVIRLRPSSFSDPERLLGLLRHELYHIADMVDPAFAYEPALDDREGRPERIPLLVSRYRVLWDASIDGRLAREGRAADSIREARLRDFAAAFPMLEDTETAFRQWFDAVAFRHSDLVAFARDPR